MKKFLKGFVYAYNGILQGLRERNMRIHVAVATAVVAAGAVFGISRMEWVVCVLSIALIFSLEAVNTAIEKLCNHVTPGMDSEIKVIKDIAAGAVLMASVGVAVVGVVVFVPYVIEVCR